MESLLGAGFFSVFFSGSASVSAFFSGSASTSTFFSGSASTSAFFSGSASTSAFFSGSASTFAFFPGPALTSVLTPAFLTALAACPFPAAALPAPAFLAFGSGVQVNMLTLMGGILTSIESSFSSHSIFFDDFIRPLTLPLPPNSFASVLKISLYLPSNGTPTRNFSCSILSKLQMNSSVSPAFLLLRINMTMLSF